METSKRDYDEEAFKLVGSNAPQFVKDAWMETVKEVGINGLGMASNGSTHITQMHIQQARIKERQFYVTFLEKPGRL